MYEWRIETSLGAVFFEYGDTERDARNAASESLIDGEYIIAIERR